MFGIGTITGKIEPCTKELFYEKINSKGVADTCALIARMEKKHEETTDEKQRKWCETRISQAKRILPVITPMATFKDNRRSVKNAIPSGLNMLDIDHVDDPRALWESHRLDGQFTIALVHVTPSTHGLRIIFVQPEGMTIEEAQSAMAKSLNVYYDACTKDLARCSFLVPKDYILYINEEVLFNHNRTTQRPIPTPPQDEGEEQSTPQPVEKIRGGLGADGASFPTAFKNVPYSEIIECLLAHAGYDTTPTAGERNNALYMLARNMRYICDFDASFVISTLPDWGLPASEVRNTVESAIKSVRMASVPKIVQEVVAKAQRRHERQEAEIYNTAFEYKVNEGGIIGEFVKNQPEYLRNAAYLASLACFGTLLTRLRGYGPDGSVLAPNFMLCISAPQASGKSFMKRIAEQILAPIKAEDTKQRKRMAEIEKENRRNRDKEDYEEKEFEGTIRLLPSNTSNRILLERMDKASGQHLMIIAEEIDSITKAEKSGRWSEKSDIYRLAYDNSEWGQDYASENSYHAIVKLYLNLMFSGTPAAVNRFFNDIENGLITRFLFIDLPDTYGQKRPKIKYMDEETRKRIDERLHTLYERMQNTGTEDGLIWINTTKMVEDALELYDEKQRYMYLTNQDAVCRDLARRRYCNYVVTMMMVETYLNDGVYTEEIRDRVIAIVNLCTEQLIANYGEEINKSLYESVDKQEDAKRSSVKVDVLSSLPDVFTAAEYREALSQCGGSPASSTQYLRRMVRGHIIENMERGIYKKVR